MELQIVCINKPYGHYNTHEAVTHYGYIDPSSKQIVVVLRETMVDWAKKAGNYAFVVDNYGNRANCYVNHKGTTEFLQTRRDMQWTDNLLFLKECPLSAR